MSADSQSAKPLLSSFLADQCEATKAKYAAELENAGDDWRPAMDLAYAESLVYFGMLERKVETLYSGKHVRGSRAWFRKSQKTTAIVNISEEIQTDMFAERFAHAA